MARTNGRFAYVAALPVPRLAPMCADVTFWLLVQLPGWVVTLVGTQRGKVVGQTSERCDVCTVSEALSAATRATLALLDHVPADLNSDPAAVVAKPVEPPPPVREDHHLAGGVLTAAGAALAIAGAVYYFTQSHDKNGLVLAGAGGGLLVGGVVTLTF